MSSSPGVVSKVDDAATNQTLLAADENRKVASVYNDSTEVLYIKCGPTATSDDFTFKCMPGVLYETPHGYGGIIDGIWANNASGKARVTAFY